MVMDSPQGVGAGNFLQKIGQYVPERSGCDAHSTYIRCVAELGLPGLVLLLAMIANAFFMLVRTRTRVHRLDAEGDRRCQYVDHGLLVSLAVFLTTGLFGTLLYVESFWWFLALPVCLCRAIDNAERDIVPENEQPHASTASGEPVITGVM